MFGCATDKQHGHAALGDGPQEPKVRLVKGISPELEKRILSLHPDHVTEAEVREVLSQAPAPQILCIHGGLLPIKLGMDSFANFLIQQGYPEASIRNPGNGELTYGYYHSSDLLAGTVAWHYERTGLPPILVGHSMGGIQAVRVLHKLAGDTVTSIPVWNPITGKAESRDAITDPLTGASRPVVGLQVGFVAVSVAGGMARIVPNEWDMNGKLRSIPDSVEEFIGFQKGMDLLGGDYLGFGSANEYHPTGRACVRNVRLPSSCTHSEIPYVRSLLDQEQLRNWINEYRPTSATADSQPPEGGFHSKQGRTVWAAEVWYGIKKHWVLSLQRMIQAHHAKTDGS
jgi:pimeloyl-ACP methyl ester carboxylesterase